MPTYRLRVTGIRYHDFKDRLDELYELARGRHMWISIEPDNNEERDAAIVYLGASWVGYIRTGEEREMALALIRESGRTRIKGKVSEIDRSNRWIYLDVESESSVTPLPVRAELSEWHYVGPLLPMPERELRLQVVLEALGDMVAEGSAWDEEMEEYLTYIECNLWRDMSEEACLAVQQIVREIGRPDDNTYGQAARRLLKCLDNMGSTESRREQLLLLMEQSGSPCMRRMEAEIAASLPGLPEEISRLLNEDPHLLIGRLWYLRWPRKRLHAFRTLLAYQLRAVAWKLEEEQVRTEVCPQGDETGIQLAGRRGNKIDIIRIGAAIYELGMVTGKDGRPPTKQAFFEAWGRMFSIDLKDYAKHLSNAKSAAVTPEKNTLIFDQMKEVMTERMCDQ